MHSVFFNDSSGAARDDVENYLKSTRLDIVGGLNDRQDYLRPMVAKVDFTFSARISGNGPINYRDSSPSYPRY